MKIWHNMELDFISGSPYLIVYVEDDGGQFHCATSLPDIYMSNNFSLREILDIYTASINQIMKKIKKDKERMTDTFRKEYRPLGDEVKEKMASIKDKAQVLYDEIVDVRGDARMIALAITRLEESVMWSIKSIT